MVSAKRNLTAAAAALLLLPVICASAISAEDPPDGRAACLTPRSDAAAFEVVTACFNELELTPDDPALLVAGRASLERAGQDDDTVQRYSVLAEGNDPDAIYRLGLLLLRGGGATHDVERGVSLLTRAAEAGHSRSQHEFGLLHYRGEQIARDHEAASGWFAKAADQGLAAGQYSLAYMLFHGEGGPKDVPEAARLFRMAADQGHTEAMRSLAFMHGSGSGLPQDDLKKYLWLRKAADHGNLNVLLELSNLALQQYSVWSNAPRDDGDFRYVPPDEIIGTDEFLSSFRDLVTRTTQRSADERLAEAARWVGRAVENRVPGALLAFGNLHLKGDPLGFRDTGFDDLWIEPANQPAPAAFVPSATEAARYFELAIAEGSVAARLNLAVLLEMGHGVPRDPEAARSLYAQADNDVFEGPARLGLLRLKFEDVWNGLSRRHDTLRQALGDGAAVSDDTIVVKPQARTVPVVVSDPVGRRLFSGPLPEQGYRLPDDASGFILWHQYGRPLSEMVQIELGGRPIGLPAGEGFGIRLGAAAFRGGLDFRVPQPTEFGVFPAAVPEETRERSRIVLLGEAGNAQVHVSTQDQLIGFTEHLYEGARFFVPDVPGLVARLRPDQYGSEEIARVAVLVDGSQRFELMVQTGCVIDLAFVPDELLDGQATDSMRLACDAMADDDKLALITGRGGEVLGHAVPAADESIPGVIAGNLSINRGISLLRMRLGGQWDALLRASRIVLDMDLREDGPNSLAVLTAGLDLLEVEAEMGNLREAQALLDVTIGRLDNAPYAPDSVRSDVYLRIGQLQLRLGRYTEAEQFLMLAHAYRQRHNETNARPRHEGLARIYGELANVSARLRRFDDAIAYQLRSSVISTNPERAETFATEIGPGGVIQVVEWLMLTGREREAEGLFGYLHRQSKREFARDLPEPLVFPLDLAVFEATFGPVERSAMLASTMAGLGRVYAWMGRDEEALPLLSQKRQTFGNLFGTNSPQATAAGADVADTQRRAGRLDEAVATARTVWAGAETYAGTRQAVRQESASAPVAAIRPAGRALLEALYAADRPGSAAEAFGVAQRLHSSSTAMAMQSFGDRLALENEDARTFLRRRQDLAEQLVALDRSLAVAMARVGGASDPDAEATIRDGIALAERRMADLDLDRPPEVVELDELARAPALPAAEVRQHLSGNELLVSYLVLDEAIFAWAIDSDGKVDWFRLPVTGVELEQTVTRFRKGLETNMFTRGAEPMVTSQRDRAAAFLSAAHELYLMLVAPLEDALRGKQHLIVVANGALTSLPFHALVSSRPDPARTGSWRDAGWLVRDYAVSIMPSVASLRSIRMVATDGPAPTAYLGIGDPIIGRHAAPAVPGLAPETTALLEVAKADSRGVSDFFRGGLADVGRVRSLPRLADTAIELRAVADSLSAHGPADLLLGRDASEARVKALPLDRFRIIHFATHGLVSGDIEGLAEPALVMTPPAIPSEVDDGLLTASEIARLELNASWVILSACNTASGERPEAEALSGLARSFFYAGARSVLVSHWPVVSSAAVKLTTRAFDEMARDTTVGRAEALRRSMLALIETGAPYEANPGYWAPFVVVGDGGPY